MMGALVLLTAACGEDGGGGAAGGTASGGQGGTGASGGEGGVQAGAQLDCPPGEVDDGDGCLAPGVPTDGCGQGFEPDGEGGCLAILPDAPCASGSMALPGEQTCRPVSPCGAGTWGDIPTDGSTLFVDASYGGGNENGSQAQPFTTVQQALAAAASGGRIAVAAGSYAEDLFIDKPVELWGKCPSEVTLGGPGPSAAIELQSSAAGTEIHSLAVTGAGEGILSFNANVVVEGVWVHDTSSYGVAVYGGTPAAEGTVRDSLIERAAIVAVSAHNSMLTLEDSVVRDTQPSSSGDFGRGVEAGGTSAPSTVVVRRSVVSASRDSGIVAYPGTLIVEDSLVTGTLPQASTLTRGGGIEAFYNASAGIRSELTIRGSVVEGSHYCGVCVEDSELLMERTTVRDTQPQQADNLLGFGVRIFGVNAALAQRPYGEIRASTIDGAYLVGLPLVGGEALVESTIVRNVQPRATDQYFGRPISLEPSNLTGLGSTATLRGVLAERGHEVGIHVLASEAAIESTWVRDIEPRAADQTFGAGIAYTLDIFSQVTASGHVSQTVIENVHAAAFAVAGGVVTASDIQVEEALAQPSGDFGDGIIVSSYLLLIPGIYPSSLEIARATVRGSARAGIASFGADIFVGESLLDCNAIQLDGESVEGADYSFEDGGGNVCRCGSEEICKVLSSGLEPPLPPVF